MGGTILSALSLFLSLEFTQEWAREELAHKVISIVMVLYYLILLYIRYRKLFSSRLSLYWMLLSILFLITKVGYWL